MLVEVELLLIQNRRRWVMWTEARYRRHLGDPLATIPQIMWHSKLNQPVFELKALKAVLARGVPDDAQSASTMDSSIDLVVTNINT